MIWDLYIDERNAEKGGFISMQIPEMIRSTDASLLELVSTKLYWG